MTGIEYQAQASATMNLDLLTHEQLTNAALGMCGEAGEFADMVKKYLYQGHSFDTQHALKELGDVMWYVALACTVMGENLDNVMQMNIDKLKKRFPEGFDKERSINREKGDI